MVMKIIDSGPHMCGGRGVYCFSFDDFYKSAKIFITFEHWPISEKRAAFYSDNPLFIMFVLKMIGIT